MSDPILPLAVWEEGTLQNDVPANDNALRVEAMRRPVLGVEDSPITTNDGDVYIVGPSPSGDFATFDPDDLTIYRGGTWYAWAPVEGMDINGYVYTGSGGWTASGGGSTVDSVNGYTGVVVLALDDLSDVDASSPSDGDVLAWDSGTSSWRPSAGGGGGGGGLGYGAMILRNPSAKFPLLQGGTSQTLGAASLAANTACAFPFTVDRAVTISTLGGRSNGSGAGKFRVGIYQNAYSGGQDMPGAIVGQTGNLSHTGADNGGSPSPSISLSPNTLYWAVTANSSGTIGMTVAGQSDVVPGMLGAAAFSTGCYTHLRATLSGGWASLPSDGTTLSWTPESTGGYAAYGVE